MYAVIPRCNEQFSADYQGVSYDFLTDLRIIIHIYQDYRFCLIQLHAIHQSPPFHGGCVLTHVLLILLVSTSSHPCTAHLFILEWFVTILTHVLLI